MSFANLKIGQRLALGFGTIIVLLCAIAFVGISRLASLSDTTSDALTDKHPKTVMVSKVLDDLNILARSMRNLLLVTDKDEVKRQLDAMADAKKGIAEILGKLGPMITSAKGKELFKNVMDRRDAYLPGQEKFVQLAGAGNTEEAKALLLQINAGQAAYIDALEKLSQYQEELMTQADDKVSATYQSARSTMLILAVIAIFVSIGVTIIITRSLLKQLGGEPDHAAAISGKIASGDLSVAIDTRAGDQASLMFAMKGMRDSLAEIVGQVRAGTETIATASAQIATGNLDLSSRTEQQASSLEETASSMEELMSTVKQNADNANQASQLAMSASEVAVKGGAAVSEVVSTMGSINESAKKIVDIISVIDGIAFQTNILALNAAVEAARAGEQGRGFAVVASEVRNLAQRSAAAAKEIKTLIADSVEKVDTGTKLVDQAGATMNEVVASVKRVTDIIGEIASASREQTSGIEQVNQAISQMDQVTQQNASLVEEAAAAAEAMQDQSQHLAQLVSVFRLNGMQTAALAPVAREPGLPAPTKARARATIGAGTPAKLAKNHNAGSAIAAPRSKQLAVESATGDDWEEF